MSGALAGALPGAFVQPSVGTVFTFRAPSELDGSGLPEGNPVTEN